MPNSQVSNLTFDGTTYDIVDETSGYTKNTGTITKVKTTAGAHTTIEVSSGEASFNVPTNTSHLTNDSGFLTSSDISGKIDTAGTGLSKSGTTLNHSNSVTAQTTQAVYPIKIDAQGHISAYGSAVTIPVLPANIVNTITTTAGTHSTLSSATGDVSFNVPTKTSHLTNDSGFVTTDEKLKTTSISSGTTNYIVMGSTSGTAETKNHSTSLSFTESTSQKLLTVGKSGTKGALRIYSSTSSSYTDLSNSATGARTLTLPDATGTLALTTDIPTVPTNVSAFTNDAGYLTSYTETDPTVPSWAKASSKPSYNFSEIGNTPTTISGYGITDALTIGTTATTAAAGNHTHTTTLATDTGTSSITLASAGKYKLTAGDTSVIFTMPTIPTVNYPVTSVNTKTGDVSLSASDVGAAASSHSHGNITSGGDITATAPTIANGDCLVINDDSASKITNGPAFDGSTTNKYLSPKGTWETLPQGTAYQAGTGLSLDSTTFNHSNSVTAQTTQAVYPIKIDAQGHISEYGSAVTIPVLPANIVNTVTTAAGTHTTVTSATGNVSFNVPTKVSHLDNDSGFVTTDEKVKATSAGQASSQYYPIFGGDSSTAETKKYSGNFRIRNYNYKFDLQLGQVSNSSPTQGVISFGSDQAGGGLTHLKSEATSTDTANGDVNIVLPHTSGTLATTSDIPSVPTSASSNTTGISIADHSTTTIYGVKSSTTTASKATGTNGTASTWTFEEKSIPNVTDAGSGSFTPGSFSGGSLTMTINGSDSRQLDIVFTAATHGSDTHVHTAPTLGTAIKVQSKSGGGNGTADTWSFSDVTVPIIADSSTTVVTGKTHSITDNGHTHSLS